MKKNILLAFCCCSLLAFTACSDDYNDATSKHVYGENENPYLKIDTEAQISATGALEVNGEHSYTVKLSDYAAKFEEKMGMSVDAVIYNPQIQISAESETKRSIFREKDKTKRSKKESAQHSKSRNKSFVMTSVSAL